MTIELVLTIIGMIAGFTLASIKLWASISVKFANLELRMKKNEEEVKEMFNALEKHKEDNKTEITALIMDNKKDHSEISAKIDTNHKTVMEILMKIVAK